MVLAFLFLDASGFATEKHVPADVSAAEFKERFERNLEKIRKWRRSKERYERRKVEKESGYVGKEFLSIEALVFKKNIPHLENISDPIATPSWLMAKEAVGRISEFGMKINFLVNPRNMKYPRRVEYIRPGTKFKVVGEFLLYTHNGMLKVDSKDHILLLQDPEGNVAEIPDWQFKNYFVDKDFINWPTKEEKWVVRQVEKFDHRDRISVHFCQYKASGKSLSLQADKKIQTFISDFKLDNEVIVDEGGVSCDPKQDIWHESITLTFSSPDSFLTTWYFLTSWSIHGKWMD